MLELSLSVTELNEYVRKSLAADPIIQNVNIYGEISNFKKHYSGHWYFTLKDNESTINCVMFRQSNISINIEPEDGLSVKLTGSVSLYTKTGQYQFYANNMQAKGMGELFAKYEKLKEKLFKLGMFDESTKKLIPILPKMIGVISSASGAVIHDILQVSSRRNCHIPICLYPIAVQGKGTAEQAIQGIRYFNNMDDVETIIIARGGGSFEDLFEFNDESLAYEIYNSQKPIISAIGHDTDFTIADFVADKRAATPSEAAEIAVMDKNSILETINNIKTNINNIIFNKINLYQLKLNNVKYKLSLKNPQQHMENLLNTINLYKISIYNLVEKELIKNENILNIYKSRLIGLNPNYALDKGFSYIMKNNKSVSSVNEIMENDEIDVYLYDGHIRAIVSSKEVN